MFDVLGFLLSLQFLVWVTWFVVWLFCLVDLIVMCLFVVCWCVVLLFVGLLVCIVLCCICCFGFCLGLLFAACVYLFGLFVYLYCGSLFDWLV